MRCFTLLCLLLIVTASAQLLSAPVRESKYAKPAVINAGTEKNIAWVLDSVVSGARVGVRKDKEVAGLALVRRQKDWEAWLKKNLRVERVPGTNLVRVSFRDGSPEEQMAIIDVVVDYYLEHDVGFRRDSETKGLKRSREKIDARRRAGKITAEQATEWEEYFKKREEHIRTLPKLAEYAKLR